MTSLITALSLVSMVMLPAVLNIFAYPFFPKLSQKISRYIQKVCAPRLFAIVRCYKKFHFWGYKKSKEKLPDQFIIISNHQSLIDIPVFMNFFRDKELRFVAKDVLSRHIPLVSEMLRSQKHCMVPRHAKPMESMAVIEKFGKQVVLENQIPVLFPEGTRSKDGNVGKFYSAGFRKLTESTGLPVAVCALDGGYQIRDLRRILTNIKKGCYRVKVLKIYQPPKTKDECSKILDEAKSMIQSQLDEWRKMTSLQF